MNAGALGGYGSGCRDVAERVEPGGALDLRGRDASPLDERRHEPGAGDRFETARNKNLDIVKRHTGKHSLQRVDPARSQMPAAIRNMAAELDPERTHAIIDIVLELTVRRSGVRMVEELNDRPGPRLGGKARTANEGRGAQAAGKPRRFGAGTADVKRLHGDVFVKLRIEIAQSAAAQRFQRRRPPVFEGNLRKISGQN